MKLGMIVQHDLKLNPHLNGCFEFLVKTCTRRISTRGDRIFSKMLWCPMDYMDVASNTETMESDGIVLVKEPFFITPTTQAKAERWVEWANKADTSEYDPRANCQSKEDE